MPVFAILDDLLNVFLLLCFVPGSFGLLGDGKLLSPRIRFRHFPENVIGLSTLLTSGP